MKLFASLLLSLLTVCTMVAQGSHWSPAPQVTAANFSAEQLRIKPRVFHTASLEFEAMKQQLATAPMRFSPEAATKNVIISIPRPDGSLERFRVVEAPVMAPELGALYPMIHSYAGNSLDDPTATIRFDVTQLGFHAMVLSSTYGSYFIDPYAWGETKYYMSYWKKDFSKDASFICEFDGHDASEDNHGPSGPTPDYGDCQFRTYSLALACTGEYAAFHGGTVAGVVAAMNTTMARVNGIYETETSVTMVLVANNQSLIYLNAATDPYTNDNPNSLLSQNQTNCNTVIGSANYDIGHVFSTGGGGLAGLGVVCSSSKAQGETGSSAPIGDAFDVDYVAHEIGHQFGANHTFHSTQSNCGGNQNNGTAFEPGSGTTIMAYAGICGASDIQAHSDAYFHAASLNEIGAHITGSANACATVVNTPNNVPTSNAGVNYIIPFSTPFLLTGTATDPDGDVINYCWEQYNAGGTSSTATPTSTQTVGPVFRSKIYTPSPKRYCPPLANVVANTTNTWEVLPSVARTLIFRLTTRDIDAIDGGCTASDTMTVTVNGAAGPFVVSTPNTAVSWVGTSSQTVTWAVANTTASPVSCANVDILLSTDGGLTFPTVLLTSTPNDGSETVVVPNTPTTTARIMVRANGNIFYDVSNVNFTITSGGPSFSVATSPSAVSICNSGATATSTATVTAAGGFTGTVALTATGVPSGATFSFAPASIVTSGTSTLTFGSTTAAIGVYVVTVSATNAGVTKTSTVSLTINNGATVPVGLASSGTPVVLTWTAVANAVSYIVEVATTNAFTSIVATGTPATNSYTIVAALTANTTYFWRVRAVNGCGTSANSATSSFTTSNITCTTYAATGLPLAISGTGTPTINSTLTVPATGTITDVDIIGLSVTHSYVSDLEISLISPATTNRIMFDNLCTTNANIAVTLDDAAAAAIPCPPTGGGTYKPSFTLDVFNGQAANGVWTLRVADGVDADGGSLNAWSLRVCYAGSATPVTVSVTGTNTNCNAATGGAVAAAAGGTAPYTYAWSNGGTTASISSLAAGTYTVTTTAAVGGTATATVVISSSTAANVTLTAVEPSGANNGSLTAVPTGATAPYTYAWSNGAGNVSVISSLGGGTYTVTATSANACVATSSKLFYCVAKGNSTNEWIQTVLCGALNNNSGNNGGYASFTNLSAPAVVIGTAKVIKLTPGYLGAAVSEKWRIYVDLNNDGDFTDTGELLRSVTATGLKSTTITLPVGTATGIHRMRILMRQTAYATSCLTYTAGEVEDYRINATAAAALIGSDVTELPTEIDTQNKLTVYPNPATTSFQARFDAPETGEYTLTMSDLQGRNMMTQRFEAETGAANFDVNTRNIQTGIYLVVVTRGNFRLVQQVVVAQ